jgi:coenzyme F420-dependent glucose-6-phosphate dehydrogenase
MLQLGWKAGTEQYPPAELLEYAIAAEDAVNSDFSPRSAQGAEC